MPNTYSILKDEYKRLWDTCTIRPEYVKSNATACAKLVHQKAEYLRVEEITKMPWYLVACLHYKECSADMSKNLHNGQRWDRVTTLVPKGRGAFRSFHESAVDAIMMYKSRLPADGLWPIEYILWFAEGYNGWGYRNAHQETLSPYLWSNTNHYSHGGYPSDGHYSSSHVITNASISSLIKHLINRGAVSLGSSVGPVPPVFEPPGVPSIPSKPDEVTLPVIPKKKLGFWKWFLGLFRH